MHGRLKFASQKRLNENTINCTLRHTNYEERRPTSTQIHFPTLRHQSKKMRLCNQYFTQKDLSFKFKIEDVGEYTTNFKKMDSNKKATVFLELSSGESPTEWNTNSQSMTSESSF